MYPTIGFNEFLTSIVCGLIGMQKVLGGCWFTYTLIILKCILQLTIESKYSIFIHIFLTILFAAISIILENTFLTSKEFANAIINSFISWPFFILGSYIRLYWQRIIRIIPSSTSILIILILFTFFLLFTFGNLNEHVWMYKGGFGGNYLIFVLGGLSGTSLVFFISKLLERYYTPSSIKDISKGCILILGFHYFFVIGFVHLIDSQSIFTYLHSLLILLLFIPIIRLTSRFFSILLGKRSS